jgi:hypothetical protein
VRNPGALEAAAPPVVDAGRGHHLFALPLGIEEIFARLPLLPHKVQKERVGHVLVDDRHLGALAALAVNVQEPVGEVNVPDLEPAR